MTTVEALHSTVRTPGWESTPTLSDWLAVVATAGVFLWLDGLTGVVLAAGLGLAVFALPVVFVFALGQLALAVALPAEPAPVTVVVGELPLLSLLVTTFEQELLGTTLAQGVLGTTLDREWSRRHAGTVLLVGGAVLAASLVALAAVQQLWLGALLIGAIVALVAYGIHRYTVVVFDGDVDE